MPARTVNQVLATYIDEHGVTRYALAGETVDVHPDDVKRFNEANGIVEVEAPTTPKKRGTQRR